MNTTAETAYSTARRIVCEEWQQAVKEFGLTPNSVTEKVVGSIINRLDRTPWPALVAADSVSPDSDVQAFLAEFEPSETHKICECVADRVCVYHQASALIQRLAVSPDSAAVAGEREQTIAVPVSLLQGLYSYGSIQTVKNVICAPGSHRACLDQVADYLEATAIRKGAGS